MLHILPFPYLLVTRRTIVVHYTYYTYLTLPFTMACLAYSTTLIVLYKLLVPSLTWGGVVTINGKFNYELQLDPRTEGGQSQYRKVIGYSHRQKKYIVPS